MAIFYKRCFGISKSNVTCGIENSQIIVDEIMKTGTT